MEHQDDIYSFPTDFTANIDRNGFEILKTSLIRLQDLIENGKDSEGELNSIFDALLMLYYDCLDQNKPEPEPETEPEPTRRQIDPDF